VCYLGRESCIADRLSGASFQVHASHWATAHIAGMTEAMIDDRWAQHGIDAEHTQQ
jgi:hypothetical protein